MATVGFIGLGVMGFPMAGHLAESGHKVRVFNRTRSKADQWLSRFSGISCDTPALATSGCDIVFMCVGQDSDVTEVTSGTDGVFSTLSVGTTLVDHTTASADLARRLATEAAGIGAGFLDAPVSGGQAGAEQGNLTIMCGGEPEFFETAAPVMEAYSKSCRLIGPSGAGQLTKMVNQLCIAGLVQGLAEGLNFGQRAGLPMEDVIDVISKGAAQSWQMDNRADSMCAGEFDFGFAVDWMRKDLKLCFEEADRIGANVPIAQMVDKFYSEVQGMGGNRQDTSSLMRRLTR